MGTPTKPSLPAKATDSRAIRGGQTTDLDGFDAQGENEERVRRLNSGLSFTQLGRSLSSRGWHFIQHRTDAE